MEGGSRSWLYQWTQEARAFSTSRQQLQTGCLCFDDLDLEQSDRRLYEDVVERFATVPIKPVIPGLGQCFGDGQRGVPVTCVAIGETTCRPSSCHVELCPGQNDRPRTEGDLPGGEIDLQRSASRPRLPRVKALIPEEYRDPSTP